MNLRYVVVRVLRRLLPRPIVRLLLSRGWVIKPGPETSHPEEAALSYRDALLLEGISLAGKRVMVFGYGGRFGIGVALLRLGAGHVVLCDRYASPDEAANRRLLPESGPFLMKEGRQILPSPSFITLVDADIRKAALQPVDLVVSSSVFEHLDDVVGIAQALAVCTKKGGAQLHFIDLRDHYFRLPFEMLSYSQRTWRRWLNPTSNLNRLRMPDYKRAFERFFGKVDVAVTGRDLEAFGKARERILPEFLSGDDSVDAVTHIRIFVSRPQV